MYIIKVFTLILLLFTILSCDDLSRRKHNSDAQHLIDSIHKEWEKGLIKDSITLANKGELPAVEKGDLATHPFYGYYINKTVTTFRISCNSTFDYAKSRNVDSMLSYLNCIKDKQSRVNLLRIILITATYDQSRLEDSLRFLSDSQLYRMITYAYNQDILSDALESNGPEFDSLYQTISSLMTKNESKAVILTFINDSIFNYYYMTVEFSLPTKNILMLHYNAAGMAGSAEKRYFLKQGYNYKELNLTSIISIVDKKMTKIAKEDASADTDRFEGLFTWNEKKGMHQLELFIQVSSGASCCPPFIVQLYTKDFKTIEPSSLKYATTQHFSDSTIKPVWKDIR